MTVVNLDDHYSICFADASHNVADLTLLLKECIEESPYAKYTRDQATLEGTARWFMKGLNKEGCLILLKKGDQPVGFLAAVMQDTHPLIAIAPTASELAWWIHPKHRNSGHADAMLEVFEMWAKWAGCVRITFALMKNMYQDKVRDMFNKRGFVHAEEWFTKEIE